MKSVKYRSIWLLLAMFFVVSIGNTSCSEDEERVVPTYFYKTTNISTSLSGNANVMYKIQDILIQQYDEGVSYMAVDESEAKQRLQQVANTLRTYDWEANGFDLGTGGSFTVQLMSNTTVVAFETITLSN